MNTDQHYSLLKLFNLNHFMIQISKSAILMIKLIQSQSPKYLINNYLLRLSYIFVCLESFWVLILFFKYLINTNILAINVINVFVWRPANLILITILRDLKIDILMQLLTLLFMR